MYTTNIHTHTVNGYYFEGSFKVQVSFAEEPCKRDPHSVKKTYIFAMMNLHFYYGVATMSRLLKTIGLFCRISSVFEGSFAKETSIILRSPLIVATMDTVNGFLCPSVSF